MNRHLIYAFVIGLLLRAAFTLFYPYETFYPDSYDYHKIAVNLVSGQGYSIEPGEPTARRAPVYPLFLAAVYSLFGVSAIAVGIIQSVLGAFASILIYKLSKEYFSERVSLTALYASALYPVLISYCGPVLTETLFSFMLVLSALFIARAVKNRSVFYYLTAGLVFGLVNLTRPDTILLPFLLLAAMLVNYEKKRTVLPHFLLFVFAAAVPFIPWTARNYSKFHYVFPGQSGALGALVRSDAWYAMNDTTEENKIEFDKWNRYLESVQKELGPAEAEKKLLNEGIEIILRHPVKFSALVAKRFPRFWITSHSSMFSISEPNSAYLSRGQYLILGVKTALLGLHVLLLASALMGIWLAKTRLREASFLLVLVFYSSLYVFVDIPNRHHVPYMPFIIIFSSVAVSYLMDKFYVRNNRLV
ncbi:MAG TPA: hypothetical protein DEE98_03400 [Elusimicrobia bacterium]|nr:MAG: hypothetical protein A2278_08215 [Elusimicrobia bacterium RIFOXYA12_FULL_49_49]OGS11062.1 MAG: hypothetical protein A2386_04350 [Elusimicrobia bacterium RIFOXYB1_FULL_48_9]OGS15951.1 MAG: hypothetical protein A2251_02050 [Elusimicrobia bacterium RIFOXYA2_FULL_47_53]OGS26368.1 MAG: hypothetical protein A2339_03220 [Elusimicrobia bacterium RIFOXYB12_FULL_50_12]OGS29119.1 MAG: hypothetical protein A2323_04590 [Elusimicrobia bacterium RIFOXYB2_FULL_46_23]HBU69411.1 hypothetical protein [El